MSSSLPNPIVEIRKVFGGTELTSFIPVEENNSFGKPIVALKKASEVMKDQYLDWLKHLFGEENGIQKSSPKAFFWFWARCVRIPPFDTGIIDRIVGHLTRLFTTPEFPRLRLEYPKSPGLRPENLAPGTIHPKQNETYDPEGPEEPDDWELEVTAKEKGKLGMGSYPMAGDYGYDGYDDDYSDYSDYSDYPDYPDYPNYDYSE